MGELCLDKSRDLSEKVIKEIKGLVLAKELDNGFIIDLKYATEDNFVKKAVYSSPVCVIRRETGEKLVKAHRIFKEKGYTIKIWDAYRPLHVQQLFYEACPNPDFVAKPPIQPMTSGFKHSHSIGGNK